MCKLCDFQATQKNNVTFDHKEVHIGIKHTCQECGHQSTAKKNLTAHKKSVHRNIKYQCTHCDYQATKKSNLARHIDSVHIRIQHKCQECGKPFTQKSHLSKQKKSAHMGIKYLCKLCDYKTTSKDHLKCHIESVHYLNVLNVITVGKSSYSVVTICWIVLSSVLEGFIEYSVHTLNFLYILIRQAQMLTLYMLWRAQFWMELHTIFCVYQWYLRN